MSRRTARVIAASTDGFMRSMRAAMGPPPPPPPPPTRLERVWFVLEPFAAALGWLLLRLLWCVLIVATVYGMSRVAAMGWEAGLSDSAPPAHVRE